VRATQENDTIAALCSQPGGAVAVIRVSGSDAARLGNRVWRGKKELSRENARYLMFGRSPVMEDGCGDSTLAVFMPAPNSYTGEDVVELHCHGGAMAAREILDALSKAGARQAEPGEFTLRAFLNGKLDLTQAEAVCDIITARGEMALHMAERQMSGALGDKIRTIRNTLVDILAECESRLDFPEEELDWRHPEKTAETAERALDDIRALRGSVGDGALLREGINVVIAGRPNTGKSSLLNLLLGFGRAIVTELPGTTRDTLEESTVLRGIPVNLIDTAGIREADDLIEKIGVGKSIESLSRAAVVVWLLDASAADRDGEIETMREHAKRPERVVAVWNKTDLLDDKTADALPEVAPAAETARCSVAGNKGIDSLLDAIERLVWGGAPRAEPEVAVNARHAALLDQAAEALAPVAENAREEDWELAAVNLRSAIHSLGVVTGETADPDVLDDIFSRFCIGK